MDGCIGLKPDVATGCFSCLYRRFNSAVGCRSMIKEKSIVLIEKRTCGILSASPFRILSSINCYAFFFVLIGLKITDKFLPSILIGESTLATSSISRTKRSRSSLPIS